MSIWKAFVALFTKDINAQDEDGLTQLHIAVKSGKKGLVESLVLRGADVNAKASDHKTPLFIAAGAGYDEIVRFLLDKGADLKAGWLDMTPLHVAAEKGHESVVKVLLARGADVNAIGNNGATALGEAEDEGHDDVARLLIEHGGRGVVACTRCGGIRCVSCSKVLRSCMCGVRLTWRPGDPQCFKCCGVPSSRR